MKRFINFGSIKQLRNIIKDVNHAAQYMGQDDDNNPIMDRTAKPQPVNVIGSEKIHGTNAAVCFSNKDGFWVQSRKNIIDSEINPNYTKVPDNAECAFFAYKNKEAWIDLIKRLALHYKIDLDQKIISIYYEWCGGNIQKKSAVSNLDKRAIIFQHFKVSPIIPNPKNASKWLSTKDTTWIDNPDANIFNIMNFQTWSLQLDFSKSKLFLEEVNTLISTIEKNSPVGESMGIKNNIGEGIVFTFTYKDSLYKFKVKGDKFKSTKVKKIKIVDEKKAKEIDDFIHNHACTPERLEQAWQEVFGINNEKCYPTIKKTGVFLKLVSQDIIKEELDILLEKNLTLKEINPHVMKSARTWFISRLDDEVLS